jgi:hypothetical protein
MNNESRIVDLTPENIAEYGVCGYKDVEKHKELRNKIEWYKQYYTQGLKIKIVLTEKGGNQGMIEYIPGKIAFRPVNAEGYMFIHCIFVGFKNEYKGKGLASALIEECILDAKRQNMHGVSVVTRKGSFMVGKEIFLKKGFQVVDKAKPDFELLALPFDQETIIPSFKPILRKQLTDFKEGLILMRSPQCPYTEKNVNAIMETARKKFKINTSLIDLNNPEAAQNNPCAFGTFCMIYNGEIISYHPISNKRFENIMTPLLKQNI